MSAEFTEGRPDKENRPGWAISPQKAAGLDLAADVTVELEYAARLLEDFEFFCFAEYRVKNNNPNHPTAQLEQWIPFEWNSQQRRLAKMIIEDWCAGRPLQYIILKARQWGCTTLIKTFNIWVMLSKPGANIQILAQDTDAVETIYEMYEDSYDDLRNRNEEWPEKLSGNKKTGWRLSSKSRLRIQTAGTDATAKKVGRSKTNTILHLSEEAFWTAARKTLTAILQTVTLGPQKGIFRESTPNGASGSFYDAYVKAKAGRNDYRAIFVPWHSIEWYEIEPTVEQKAAWGQWRDTGAETFREQGGFEEDEDGRIDDLNLTCAKWLWWAWALHNKCDGDPDTMRQEFPDDDVSCFLESGSPVFRPRDIARSTESACAPQRYDVWAIDGAVDYRPDRRGRFRVWRLPEKGATYLLIADVCAGHSSRDRSVAAVWQRTPIGIEQVAGFAAKCEPHELAESMYMLHVMYNRALAAPETNTYGKSVVDYLKKMGCNRFYRRKAYDQVTRQYTSVELGWSTSSTSRPTLIAACAKYMRQGLVVVKDVEAASELRTFVRDTKSGKEQAALGSNDDYCMVVMIACRVDEDTRMRASATGETITMPRSVRSGTMEHMFLRDRLQWSKSGGKVSIAQDLAAAGFYPEVSEEW